LRCKGHFDGHISGVIGLNVVYQPEIDNVDGNFRVVALPDCIHDFFAFDYHLHSLNADRCSLDAARRKRPHNLARISVPYPTSTVNFRAVRTRAGAIRWYNLFFMDSNCFLAEFGTG
jgi:hypothetical protein